MRYLMVFVLVGMPSWANSDEWIPPKNPDPSAILQEARRDTADKKYSVALAKYVWFHENALSIQPAQYGVRLSFALMGWHELGKQYPPALLKLEETRDKAAAKVREGKSVRESFIDLAAINRTLGEESRTKDDFEALEAKDPETARQIVEIAQAALVRGKAYKLLGKYVDPKRDYARISESYRQLRKLNENPAFKKGELDFAGKKFANDAATLVAILVVNDRREEAEKIAAAARVEWNDAAFHASLDDALKGIVPDPWP